MGEIIYINQFVNENEVDFDDEDDFIEEFDFIDEFDFIEEFDVGSISEIILNAWYIESEKVSLTIDDDEWWEAARELMDLAGNKIEYSDLPDAYQDIFTEEQWEDLLNAIDE